MTVGSSLKGLWSPGVLCLPIIRLFGGRSTPMLVRLQLEAMFEF